VFAQTGDQPRELVRRRRDGFGGSQSAAHPPIEGPEVTVQVVKTGITPQLATSDRFWEAETEPLHPAGRLHMRR
jgi:hypothetical protein